MKKFMRTCLILILILFGAGLTLLIAGAAMGGTNVVSKVVNDVTGGRVQMDLDPSSDDFGFNIGGISSESVKEKVLGLLDHQIYKIDDFTTKFENGAAVLSGDVEKFRVAGNEVEKLDLSVAGCELTIAKSEDDSFWVEAKNVGKLQVLVKGDTLKMISTVTDKKISGSNVKNVKVTLYVPAEYSFDEAEVELGAGIIRAEGFQAERFELEIGAGEVEMKGLQVENFELEVGAGSVKLMDAELGKVKCSVGAGNVNVDGKLNGDAEISCAAGNVAIKLSNSFTDFNYEVACTAGNVTLADKKYSGLAKTQEIDNDAKHDVEISCTAGNLKVSFE